MNIGKVILLTMSAITILYMIPSIITGFISSVSGMGGGAILLAILTTIFPIRTVVPIHGVVQMGANISRSYILRKFIIKKMSLSFLLGMPIGVFLGVKLLSQDISENHLKIIISAFILFTVFKPKKMPQLKIKDWQFFFVGIAASTLGLLIGSVGPFLALFFLRDDISKEQLVATKSSMQMIVHTSKIPSFLYLQFNYSKYTFIILFLVIGVLIGNYLGIKVLKKLDKKMFTIIFKTSLSLAAMRLLYSTL